jgi:hypothetical protein
LPITLHSSSQGEATIISESDEGSGDNISDIEEDTEKQEVEKQDVEKQDVEVIIHCPQCYV